MLENKNHIHTNVYSVILGSAIGDALGVPVEFQTRKSLIDNPVTDYIGYGSHNVPAGTWSDDTSMTLATMDSLCNGINFEDTMEKFLAWIEHADYTATNEVFDFGLTTNFALCNFKCGKSPLACGCIGENDNGNGSLMRIAPVVLYCYYKMPGASINDKIELIHKFSSLTHAHLRSKIACGIYAFILMELLNNHNLTTIHMALEKAMEFYINQPEYSTELSTFSRLFDKDFSELSQDSIRSSGYVVDTLEAAIWCLLNTSSYSECVLKAVNLGDDTDTVGAIAGSLAGCLYGLDGIPNKWHVNLINIIELINLSHKFSDFMCDGVINNDN